MCLFDTRAPALFVGAGLVKRLRGVPVRRLETPRRVTTLARVNLEVQRAAMIEFTHRDNTHRKEFYIIGDEGNYKLILGYSTVKRMRGGGRVMSKRVPAKCAINTGDKGPVSWNRPLRSLREKEAPNMMVENLEERGELGKSVSTCLNLVVLTAGYPRVASYGPWGVFPGLALCVHVFKGHPIY